MRKAAHPLAVQILEEGAVDTDDDLVFRDRVRLFARAGEAGVAQACRGLGYHRSWCCPGRASVHRHGLEIQRRTGQRGDPGDH
jgi:hypothetical protein